MQTCLYIFFGCHIDRWAEVTSMKWVLASLDLNTIEGAATNLAFTGFKTERDRPYGSDGRCLVDKALNNERLGKHELSCSL